MRCATPALLALFAGASCAQVITTAAGTNWFFPPYLQPALNAPLGTIAAVALDVAGNIYAVDSDNNIVVQIAPNGVLSTFAGNGLAGFSGDGGAATAAALNSPSGVTIDSAGNLYIADTGNYRVRKVTPDGFISTVAGNGSAISYGDGGLATSAGITPYGLAVDGNGNLYISDVYASRVRKLTASGTIVSFAGNGQPGASGDNGPATSAGLFPVGLALDSSGNLFIADYKNHRIRKVSTNGTITTVAGTGQQGFSGDGAAATRATLNSPEGVSVDASGNIYIADTENHRLREVTPNGVINTIAGNGSAGFFGDAGPAVSAGLYPTGSAVDAAGDIYIADAGNKRVRIVPSTGLIATVAGNGNYRFAGDTGPASIAALSLPIGIAIDGAGNFYFADNGNERVRRVTLDGTITTVAGNGAVGFSGDGVSATSSGIDAVAVAVDKAGNLYIADQYNNRIRKVAVDGLLTTVAGNGNATYSGDRGPATAAGLNAPAGLALDAAGNLYIADQGNSAIRKVDTSGIITTVAGIGVARFNGDGGQATAAALYYPSGVALDAAGNLYIADQYNGRIRKVTPNGVITTIAGLGGAGYTGDGGPAVNALLNFPATITFDAAGNLYISDMQNNRVRMVNSSGIINTVAGSGSANLSGDGGQASSAGLNGPSGIALDPHGNLFIVDSGNDRIREVVAITAVTLQLSSSSLSFSATSAGVPPEAQSVNLSSSITGVAFTATASDPWLSVSPSSGSIPSSIQVSVDPSNLAAGAYHGTVTISAPSASPSTATISVSFTVQPALPPQLSVGTQTFSFSALRGGPAVTGQIQVSNTGGGQLSFSATTTTTTGGNWLTVSPGNGVATPVVPAPLIVTVTPGSLPSGTYQGTITITSDQATATVAVTFSIADPNAVITVSQSGLTFTAVEQGGAPLAQTFQILNTGQGSMNWSSTSATLSGGSWLQVSPSSGLVSQPYLDSSTITVAINPSGLTAGNYYGQIQIAAPATNSPQVLTVILTVLPAGSTPAPEVQPTGLIFTGVAGVSPGSQDVMLGNLKPAADTYLSSGVQNGFTYLPTSASVSPNQPATLRVFPDFTHLQPGTTYRGSITLQFSDGTPRTISVLTVVAPTPASAAISGLEPQTSAGCTSKVLQVLWQSPLPNFSVVQGNSVTLQVKVIDGCGNLIGPPSGGVTASFFNHDQAQAMKYSGNGLWTLSWKPGNSSPAQGTVIVTAFNAVGLLVQSGSSDPLPGTLAAPGAVPTPAVTSGGVQNAASFVVGAPIAPGTLITLKGSALADADSAATVVPLPTQWNGAQVLLGTEPLPLLYTASGQVNVQVPYDVPVNTPFQVTVQRDSALSVPEQFVIALAQPGIFTVSADGTGPGIIYKSDGATLAQPASCAAPAPVTCAPANVGETVTIYCTGLGSVTPTVPAGTPPPSSPLSTVVNPVAVTIGGQDATVTGSILAPGQPGVYVVSAVVPAGVSGDAERVVVTVAGQISSPVTMSVQ